MQAEATIWETLARTAGGLLLLLIGAYTSLVHKWHNNRFESMEKRISDTDKTTARHDVEFARIGAHVENVEQQAKDIKASIQKLHDKLDRLVSNG